MRFSVLSCALFGLLFFSVGCGDDTSSGTVNVGPSVTVGTGPASDKLSFFLTSIGNGENGANFGGVAGTDKLCQAIADSIGSNRTWHAYVSTASQNARDRIGSGPWYNANDVMVAADVTALHTDGMLGPVILTEQGGSIDFKNAHDVITGSNADGTFSGSNCGDYSQSGSGSATVGHADATKNDQFDNWNSVHPSQGCDPSGLQKTAGQAHLYCFAID